MASPCHRVGPGHPQPLRSRMLPPSLTCMIAGDVASGVTDDRAGPTGKEVVGSRAEPPADGDIDRARLSLNQARPDQRHQAGPIYLSRDIGSGVSYGQITRLGAPWADYGATGPPRRSAARR